MKGPNAEGSLHEARATVAIAEGARQVVYRLSATDIAVSASGDGDHTDLRSTG